MLPYFVFLVNKDYQLYCIGLLATLYFLLLLCYHVYGEIKIISVQL